MNKYIKSCKHDIRKHIPSIARAGPFDPLGPLGPCRPIGPIRPTGPSTIFIVPKNKQYTECTKMTWNRRYQTISKNIKLWDQNNVKIYVLIIFNHVWYFWPFQINLQVLEVNSGPTKHSGGSFFIFSGATIEQGSCDRCVRRGVETNPTWLWQTRLLW